MTDGDLPTIGEASFQTGALLTFDDGYFMAGLGQVPGACHTGKAGTENDHAHERKGTETRGRVQKIG